MKYINQRDYNKLINLLYNFDNYKNDISYLGIYFNHDPKFELRLNCLDEEYILSYDVLKKDMTIEEYFKQRFKRINNIESVLNFLLVNSNFFDSYYMITSKKIY